MALMAAGALAVAGLSVATASTANAASQVISAGNIDWGIKQSLQDYATAGGGAFTPTAGATLQSAGPPQVFRFGTGTGTYDPTTNALDLSTTGTLTVTRPDHGVNMVFSNLRVVRSGSSTKLVADVLSGTTTVTTYDDAELVSLTLGSPSVAGNTVTYTNAVAKVTAAAAAGVFGSFYVAEQVLDPVSFSYTSSAPPPEPTPAPPNVTNGVLDWAWNDSIQNVAGPCHFLSAGTSGNASLLEAGYKTSEGAVSITRAGVTPTWADKCSLTGGVIDQKVHWTGGTGNINPATGAGSLSFLGTLQLNYNSTTPLRITNPVLTIDNAGAGTLKGTVSGYAPANPGPTPPASPEVIVAATPDVTVATFSGASGSSPFTVQPAYDGVTITPPSGLPAQVTSGVAGWGAWPLSWISTIAPTGNGPFFYTTSTGSTQIRKAPKPLTFSYGVLGASDDAQTLAVTIAPDGEVGDFSWEILENDQVNLTNPRAYAGDHVQYDGALNEISVTDGRVTGTWVINAAVSNFSGAGLDPFGANFLGWTPAVVTQGAGIVLGNVVLPSDVAGQGLAAGGELAHGAVGATPTTGRLGAALLLRVPRTTAPGSYVATMTVTGIAS
jgi:hypothetical protein